MPLQWRKYVQDGIAEWNKAYEKIGFLHAIEVPPYGGDTLFANQYLAYEALSEGMKRLLGTLRAVHSDRTVAGPNVNNAGRTTKARADADWRETINVHPVVRTHPETKRKLLYVNYSYTMGFEGMTEEESRPLLTYLLEHDLQGNARRVGGLLRERLRSVAAQVPHVREVRGRGLMLGIELTRPGTDEADPAAASAVLEAARDGGLLIGKGGGHDTSALRVAPPLTLTVAEAEEGAAILESALRSL